MVKNMTEGNPTRLLIKFTLPMLIGNLFQQLYNIVDSVIVGKFIGKNALAAVGSSFMAMNFFSFVIIGLCLGSGIVYSYYFGEENYPKLRNSIFVSFLFIGIFTILLSTILVINVEKILSLMNTPSNIINDSIDYLRIIFLGLFFVFLYNGASSLLRSIGDSSTPLIFLVISALINIGLDLYFVLVLNMGVKGVAYATIVAQGVSSILCLIYGLVKIPLLRIRREDIFLEKNIIKQIGRYSFLTSIQQSVMTFGMLIVQSYVNIFGPDTIAAFASGGKVESIANLPLQDFGNAFGTYVAQNKGANREDRIELGLKSIVKIILIFGLMISALIYFNAGNFMRIFVESSEQNVINIGIEYMSILSIFYTLLGFLMMYYGYYRGIGSLNTSLLLTVISLGTRVLIVATLSPKLGRVVIWWAAPIGWALADLVGSLIYFKTKKSRAL